MAEPTKICPRCQRVVLEYHFGGGNVCPICIEGTKPQPDPTPGKWAPLSIGLLSIVVNPMFLSSMYAIGRARAWLHYAATRDAEGEYSPWHASIRSNAIWALALTAGQPLMVFFIVASIVATHDVPPPVESSPFDERSEILAMLENPSAPIRALALCQLDELPADPDDAPAIANALRRELPDLGIACGELAFAHASGSSIAERYTQQPVPVRDAILTRLADRDAQDEATLLLLEEMELEPVAAAGIESFTNVVPDDDLAAAFIALTVNESTRNAARRPLATMCARDARFAQTVARGSELSRLEEARPVECSEMP